MLNLLETNLNVGVPCGALLLSPWIDLTSSLPSYTENGIADYIPGPELIKKLDLPSSVINTLKTYSYATYLLAKSCPELKDELLSERGHFYAPEPFLKYSLISPMNTKSFTRFPPLMMVII
ncbi:hypothetical protein DSO57_1019263 [Entomophthora muscae]|uniref:Uncharacterized protein n=2 Tax=Entomophthora muscae TaxID=34485 RepID=A0ACC2UPU2_9FUNG|nr:hypothetical protein DSO57_1021468 [Entomophthora muscae]KAJ9088828.1 hypothetical protein DSO57_1019263 [Entomophthora muscae]